MWRVAACVVALAGLGLAHQACVESSSTAQAPDRSQLLSDIGSEVLLPLYRDFHTRSAELSASVTALCQQGTAQELTAARDAWRAARVPWKQAEALGIGPIVDLRVDAAVDFWPIRRHDVQEVLDGAETIDDAYVDGLGATRKGLPVLELLVFEPEDPTSALAGLAENDGRRCLYAAALARDVEQQAALLLSAWEPAEGDFGRELASAGKGSERYASQADAMNEIVNELIAETQRLESNRLAKPLGRQDGGTPQPGAVESPFSHNALADAQNHALGLRAAYLGHLGDGEGRGLHEAVGHVSPAIARDIERALDATRVAIAAIPEPLEAAVVDEPATVEEAFLSAKALLRLFSADMAGALGATVTFSDNDGD